MSFLEKSNWVVILVAVPTLLVYLAVVGSQVIGTPIAEIGWVQPMIVAIAGAIAALVLAMARAGHFWIANAIFLGGIAGALLSSATKVAAYHGPFQQW